MANLVGMAVLLSMTLSVSHILTKFREQASAEVYAETSVNPEALATDNVKAGAPATLNEAGPPAPPQSQLAARLGLLRHRFITRYPGSGSNIDGDVEFNSMMDIFSYIPRAAVIGFLAPFPGMWFASGKQVGLAARLLVGLETLLMYAIEVFAIYGLWQGRRQFPVWFLSLVTLMSIIALALVVTNIGALYRMRYAFLMPLIILGAKGATHILERPAKSQEIGRGIFPAPTD
jgi:hypothetical protein